MSCSTLRWMDLFMKFADSSLGIVVSTVVEDERILSWFFLSISELPSRYRNTGVPGGPETLSVSEHRHRRERVGQKNAIALQEMKIPSQL